MKKMTHEEYLQKIEQDRKVVETAMPRAHRAAFIRYADELLCRWCKDNKLPVEKRPILMCPDGKLRVIGLKEAEDYSRWRTLWRKAGDKGIVPDHVITYTQLDPTAAARLRKTDKSYTEFASALAAAVAAGKSKSTGHKQTVERVNKLVQVLRSCGIKVGTCCITVRDDGKLKIEFKNPEDAREFFKGFFEYMEPHCDRVRLTHEEYL